MHYGEGRYLNIRYYIDKDETDYRGIRLKDYEKVCTYCLHTYQDMLGDKNSQELVSHLNLFIGLVEQVLFDGYYDGTDEELFQEDREWLN